MLLQLLPRGGGEHAGSGGRTPDVDRSRHDALRYVSQGSRAFSCRGRQPGWVPPVARDPLHASDRHLLQHARLSGVQRGTLAEALQWTLAVRHKA